MFLTANMLKALIAKALSKHFHSRGYMERMQKAVRQVSAPPESCMVTCAYLLIVLTRERMERMQDTLCRVRAEDMNRVRCSQACRAQVRAPCTSPCTLRR